jgi:hypothetical protein
MPAAFVSLLLDAYAGRLDAANFSRRGAEGDGSPKGLAASIFAVRPFGPAGLINMTERMKDH